MVLQSGKNLTKIETDADIKEMKVKFNEELNDLKNRLISIERRVDGEKLYLDVAGIPIPRSEIQTLDKAYQSFGNGSYYVAPPTFDIWDRKIISQLDFASMILGEDLAASISSMPGFGDIFSEKNMLFWSKGDDSYTVKASGPLNQIGIENIELFPSVSVMPVDENFINSIGQAVQDLQSEMLDSEKIFNQLVSSLDDLSSKVNEMESLDDNHNQLGIANIQDKNENIDQKYEKILEESEIVSRKINFVENLTKVSNGDLAGFILFGALFRQYQMATGAGAKFKIISAEKRANVLYMRTHTEFVNQTTDRDDVTSIFLDEEVFFIEHEKKGLLVRIQVPSYSLRSAAYAWTQAWLTSLRVPLRS